MATASPLKRTGLFQKHVDAGARLVAFAGWHMPVQYTGILSEALAVRSKVGLFDVSHMGRLYFTGSHASPLLEALLTASVSDLPQGRARYCMLCNQEGGIIDDVVVARLESDRFLLVCNAGNRDEVVRWIADHARDDYPYVSMVDRTEETALIALQGPAAESTLLSLMGQEELSPTLKRPFGLEEQRIDGWDAVISHTGYTGENGFELMVDVAHAQMVWDRLVELGATPCGLGARDVLRLEAGLRLHGSDMDASTTPLEAGLDRFVRLDTDFVGAEALRRQKENGVSRSLAGLKLDSRAVARGGYPLLSEGAVVGKITSGTSSPTLKESIAMGYVPPELAQPGQALGVEVRGEVVQAEVFPLPFYSRKKSP